MTTLDIRVWLTADPRLPTPGSLAGAADMMFQVGFNSDLTRATGTSFGAQCTSPGSQGIAQFAPTNQQGGLWPGFVIHAVGPPPTAIGIHRDELPPDIVDDRNAPEIAWALDCDEGEPAILR